MKLKNWFTIYVFVMLLALAPLTWAATTGGGNEVFSGEVGIGTTTPQSDFVIIKGNVGIGTWTAAGGALIVKGGGNVGINTAWPGTILDIGGEVRATALVGDGSAVTFPAADGFVDGANNYVYTAVATDNLGIGTSAPQSLFEITSTQSRILFRVNDNGPADVSPFVITSEGNVGVATSAPVALVEISSASALDLFRVNDSGVTQEATPFVVNVAGNIGIGSALPSETAVANRLTLSIDQDGSGAGNRFTYNPNTNGSSNRTLGIGYVTPGTANQSGILMQTCLTNQLTSATGPGCALSVGGAAATTAISLQSFGGNVGVGTFVVSGALVIENGNLGIGTGIPTALVEVSTTGAQNIFRVMDNGDGDTTPTLINSDGNFGIGTATPGAQVDILALDNTTGMRINLNATQANVTGADTYVSFNSTTGQEGSITGTGVAGVLAYNTFTGAHWTKIDDKTNLEPNMVIEATGEKFLDNKPQLVKSRVCSTRQSKAVWGVYGGMNEAGYDVVVSLGTGKIWVTNTNGDIKVSDYLQSSSVFGLAEKQDDNVLRNYTIAKALEPVTWTPGQTRKLIACTYHSG